MKQLIFIFFISFTFRCSQPSCDFSNDYIPNDLNEAIVYLDCTFEETAKIEFKNQSESEAVSGAHFGIGLQLRNRWGLWKGDNELSKFFHSIGIEHPDDISGIILTSYHRYLNQKSIDLETQVEKYKKYWETDVYNSNDSTLLSPDEVWDIGDY